MFLSLHPSPLIIDEVQRAPQLFAAIENVVNEAKRKNEKNYGMYILTGSQMYKMMKEVSESMSGRVAIIHMSPLSRSEILNREEVPFAFSIPDIQKRAKDNPLSPKELFENIVMGSYPELYSNPLLKPERFYSDYAETYLERDVSEIIHLKDKASFQRFLELLASLTGEELIYSNIANIIGVDVKTIQSWISVLQAGDIIYLLEPYYEDSISKRIVKRPKIYFTDTGLACYLAKLNQPEILMRSAFSGRFVETYIINEIRKSYLNNGLYPNFYYYRDSNQNEIDLVILDKGKLHRVECKSGMKFTMKAVKGFRQLDSTKYVIGAKAILCNADGVYPLEDGVYVLPIAGI